MLDTSHLVPPSCKFAFKDKRAYVIDNVVVEIIMLNTIYIFVYLSILVFDTQMLLPSNCCAHLDIQGKTYGDSKHATLCR